MHCDFLTAAFAERSDTDAVIWNDHAVSYAALNALIERWSNELDARDVRTGTIAVLDATYSPNAVALFIALVDRGCIVVPLTSLPASEYAQVVEIAQAEVIIRCDANDNVSFERSQRQADHELYQRLRDESGPGLVIFTSGSTGQAKGAVHDMRPMLRLYRSPRRPLRTIAFLLFDHIGGVNTLFYTLASGGCLITPGDHSPEVVLASVARHRAELLPVTPTFINLMLLSEAYRAHDLSSLKVLSYGTEPMPEDTLKRLHALLPHIRLVQKYGMSEFGIVESKSPASDSLWLKLGGENLQTRVVDGVLHIKTTTAMLGYLNAPSPFVEDGWLNTGDRVEVDGDRFRILGRDSETINVGGEKVSPVEIEEVIQQMSNVAEVTVYGERNPIMGQIVCARIRPKDPEAPAELIKRLKAFCSERLKPYKVPVRVEVVDESRHSRRFKKLK